MLKNLFSKNFFVLLHKQKNVIVPGVLYKSELYQSIGRAEDSHTSSPYTGRI